MTIVYVVFGFVLLISYSQDQNFNFYRTCATHKKRSN